MSDLAEKTYGGGTPTTSNEAYWNGDIPWIQSSDVVDGKLLGVEPRKWITQDGLNNSAAQLIPGNSIAIITRVGVGKLAFMPYSYATSQDFLSLSKLNAEPLFTVYACYKKLQSELNAVQGTSIKGITKDELLAKNIMVPRYTEQQQIGAFFKQLDNLITLHQRKCALLFSPFQAFISMMFTTSTFSWEQRKVGDLLIERNQQAPMSDEYPLMAFIANEGVAPKGERYDRSALVTDTVNKLYKKTEKGDFIYSSNNLETGSIGLNKYGKACISPVYSIFEPTGIADSDFLGRRLVRKDFINAMVKWRQGVIYGQWRIHESDFLKIEITVPSVEEQRKIGTYLDQLDHLITLHQRKFEKLTNVKKSMLEKMFPQNGSSYPEIRFKGFTDPWEQRKLSEITDKVTEKNAGLQYVETFTNSAEFGIISQRDFFDHDIAKLGSLDGYYIVKNEDFVYNPRISTSAPVGPINRNKLGRTGVMSPLYTVFRPHDIDTTYLEYFFKCGYWHSFMNFNGDSGARSDRFSIRDNVFFQMPIPIPDIDEQRKIGELLTCLDNLITLHQRECISFTGRADRLILTANKKRTTSSWEQRKFEEIAVRSSVICSDDTLPRVEYEDIVSGTGRLNKDIYAKQSSKSGIAFHQGDVLYGKLRPYLQNWLLPTFDGLAVGDFWVLQPQNADSSFLYRLIQSRQFDEVANQSTGTKMPRADWKLVSKTVFSIPSNISEQAAIGTYFTALDSLITLHQRKPFLMKWRTSDANRNQTNRLVL